MSNLYILSPDEQRGFDHPPILPAELRSVCFSINNELEKEKGVIGRALT